MPGVIESFLLYALTAALPGLSNLALGLLTTGLTYGALAAANFALQLAFQKKPASPKAQDVQANIRSPLMARRRIYGTSKNGSGVIFGFRRGTKIYMLHYVCEGPIDSITAYYLNNKPVTLDGSGFVTDAQYQYGGRSRVQILSQLGTMSQGPFAKILAAFPELDRPVTPFRHRGCVMVLQIVEEVPQAAVSEVYPNNLPSLQMMVKGLKPYDPRTSLSVWTENSSLCLLAEIMDVYGFTTADSDKIDFAAFASFATHCDEAVALKAGGSELRYRSSGTILLDAENEPRISALADTCNGDVYIDPQGRWTVRKKVSVSAGITLGFAQGDHLSVALESGRRGQKKFNTVSVTYTDRQLNWKENQAFYINADSLADDGQSLIEPIQILMCPSATQAQRLGKLFERNANPQYAGTMTAGTQALDLMENPVFMLDMRPEDDLIFVARSGALEFDADSQVTTFSLQSVAADSESWNAALEEQEWVALPPALPSNVADVALTVTATVSLLNNSAPVINFSWVAAGAGVLPDSYSQEVQVSLAGLGEWNDASVNQEAHTARYGPVADGGSYDWRIRNIHNGTKYDWQTGGPLGVVVDSTAPLALDSVTAPTSGLGSAQFTLVTKTDTHLRYLQVFRNTGGALNEATDSLGIFGAVAGSTFSYVDGDATRVNLITNGVFAADANWTKGTGWTIASGVGTKAAGTASDISQAVTLTAGQAYRTGFKLAARMAGAALLKFTGGTTVNGTSRSANGRFNQTLTALTGNNTVAIQADAALASNLDDVIIYAQSGSSLAANDYQYFFKPLNVSLVGGPVSGPFAVAIT